MIVRYYPYVLTLGSPLVLTSPGGDPNSAASMDFIPGSAIRGAVAGVLTDASPAFHRLILSGAVRYLNAYLLQGGERCLPTPTSFRREKYSPQCHDLAGYSGESHDDEEEPDWPSEQLARLPSRYLTLNQPTPQGCHARLTGCVHHQRDRGIGKPTESTGALFRYDALEEEQQFQGFILCCGENDAVVERLAEQVRRTLSETILLGRSRRAGYGGSARLEWGDPRPREVEGQRMATGTQNPGAILRTLLVSDYQGRDSETGQVDPSAWVDELARRLDGRVEVLRRFGEAALVGGYNRKWGMELPQALVQRAGAVAVFRVRQAIPEEHILTIEHQGLGERRIEGFGRVAFFREPGRMWSLGSEPRPERVAIPTKQPPALLRKMEQRLLREAVDARVLEVAGQLAGSAPENEIPTRSLLGRLRVPLRLPPAQALGQLRQWLGKGQNSLRQPARRQLERCRIQPSQSQRQSLAEWLELVSNPANPANLGNLLNYQRLAQDHHFVSSDSARDCLMESAENDRVRALLVDALLAAMARRRNQDAGGAS